MMNKQAKIFIAGHRGMVGSSIVRTLQKHGYQNLILRNRSELDLTQQKEVLDFLIKEKPDYIFIAAAKVGGILANDTYRADFLYENLMIQTNLIHAAWKAGIRRLLFLGSSCCYPRDCPQPIKEEYLLTGSLEQTNEPYAIAKNAGIKLCESYNRQYGTEYVSVMPSNLYGPHDNYDANNSHVLPALLRKAHTAKINQKQNYIVWGSGKPLREFLYVDDLAAACLLLMESNALQHDLFNIGTNTDISIFDLAKTINHIVGFQGSIEFDTSKPDGTPRKLLNVDRIQALGWKAQTSLEEGIKKSYADFLQNIPNG